MKKGTLLLLLLVTAVYLGKHFYMQPKYDDGETTPDFAINKQYNFSDLRGQYVLLDFWGSWCGPCISEFDRISELYKNYNDKSYTDAEGFAIVGVAVEQDQSRWERAIHKYKLNWTHQVLDLSTSLRFFNSPIATEYGVKEIPTKFLIDPKGVIIFTNPSFEEIRTVLEAKLTK